MSDRYFLVTGSVAAEVERLTGLKGADTPLGVLVEKPKPFDGYSALAKIDRALNPCICGSRAIIHQSNCPMVSV